MSKIKKYKWFDFFFLFLPNIFIIFFSITIKNLKITDIESQKKNTGKKSRSFEFSAFINETWNIIMKKYHEEENILNQ